MVTTPPTLRTRLPHNELRRDVEGLRALAVVAVVLYHARVPGFAGGFVGVDIFFVISGFLICGLIYDEITTRGSFSFTHFYARRARRILPAAAVVLSLVAVFSWIVLPPLRTLAVLQDVLAAVLYVANWRLALTGTDYSHAGAEASPVQHYWSLSVEEQFYFVWPVLFVLAGWIGARLHRRWLALPFFAITILAVAASFAYNLYLTEVDPVFGYLSTLTRVWQFALGALIALTARRIDTTAWPIGTRIVVGYLGLGAVAVACVTFNEGTPYPGTAALLPSLGIAAVLLVGHTRDFSAQSRFARAMNPSVLLSTKPFGWLGSLSYSLYLWHWPVIVFFLYFFPNASWQMLLGAAAVSLLPAYASYRFLENPIRSSGTVQRHPLQGISIGIAATAITIAVFMVVDRGIYNTLAHEVDIDVAVAHGQSGRDPFATGPTSGAVRPSVVNAQGDTPAHYDECILDQYATEARACLIDAAGSLSTKAADANRYVLLGDSHAQQWAPLVTALAMDRALSVEMITKIGCPAASVTVFSDQLNRTYRECDDWRESAFERLEDEPPPRAIFIGTLNHFGVPYADLSAGWSSTLARLKKLGVPLYYFIDTPYPNFNVPECISARLSDWSECAFSPKEAFEPDPLAQQIASGNEIGVRALNFNSLLCPQPDGRHRESDCPAVRGGVLLYRDNSHLTGTAVESMIPYGRQIFASSG